MRKMTEQNLSSAFAGESQAHMKYMVYSEEAEKAGFPGIARLFRAIAFAERVHAGNHLRALGGINKTPQNLDAAIGGETYEVDEMYPAFNEVAKLQHENQAERSIVWALEAEKIHAEMYRNAKKSAEKNEDIKDRPVYICEVCGHTTFDPPDRCPICKAPKEKFKRF
jgi:rubrerythrin